MNYMSSPAVQDLARSNIQLLTHKDINNNYRYFSMDGKCVLDYNFEFCLFIRKQW